MPRLTGNESFALPTSQSKQSSHTSSRIGRPCACQLPYEGRSSFAGQRLRTARGHSQAPTFAKLLPIAPFGILGCCRRSSSDLESVSLSAAVTQQLTHKLQRPSVQEQVHRKTMPKGMTPNLERCLSPNLLDQPVNVRTDRLTCDRKDPLVLPKLPHIEVTSSVKVVGTWFI